MSKIINVSRKAVEDGFHKFFGSDTILIQISDPAQGFPTPKKWFSKTFQFEFLDAETGSEFDEEFLISNTQAAELVTILECALDSDMNVVVHCNAGICRSGAVAEIGEMMGFEYAGNHKQPNLRVKGLMMDNLGWGYSNED
jgi:predicted protein tyrosine phosphatase